MTSRTERAALRNDSVIAERAALCDARVTLNGRPAVIRGYRNRFANVAALDGSAQAEWAWPTAARIVAAGGAFTS